MHRTTIRSLVAAGLIAAGVLVSRAAAPAAAPAAQSLADMKAQLATLKEQEAALEAKIQAAEAHADPSVPALVNDLNAMPKNLWPGESDNATKQGLRDKWLEDHIKPGADYEFSGTVAVSSPIKINEAGKPSRDGLQLTLDCGKQMIWGKEKTLRVVTQLGNVAPEDAMDWNDKTTITIHGKNHSVNTQTNPVEIRLEVSEKK
ncbi:MAG TPA: hypothetical protein VH253_19040 [Phycisphaerae bacterium]|nr:hypothetical protein [Phycisphaerae bacterium]